MNRHSRFPFSAPQLSSWVLVILLVILPRTLRSEPPATAIKGEIAVRGGKIYTMDGPPIENGVVVIRDGKIQQVGPASQITIPAAMQTLDAGIVTPGLIDTHSVVGLAGILNQDQDQDQLDASSAIQPQLRATDSYHPDDPLIAWIRGFGVTTVHTGHAPAALLSGQTMIVKTVGKTIDEAVVVPAWGIAVTLGENAQGKGKASPGTRGKMVAMLRQKLLDAQRYLADRQGKEDEKRDLELEALGECLEGKLRFLVTADRAIDIRNALELAREFNLRLVLDSGAEAHLMLDALRHAAVPVMVHPTMARAGGDRENLTFRSAALLADAGLLIGLQSGYEPYVPKTRVVLFEAGVAAAHGLGPERALSAITRDAARLLEIEDRVGSITAGKDGDLALFDGDPFEYTTHCIGVVIDGNVVSNVPQ